MVHRHANVHSLECTYITLLPSGFELRAYDDCIAVVMMFSYIASYYNYDDCIAILNE